MDFYRYFHISNKIMLENISYETTKLPDMSSNFNVKMNCKDTIVAQTGEKGIKFNFNRKVDFEPEFLIFYSRVNLHF